MVVVLLHNIRSSHNVGSIFRTADASGVKKIYLCGITPLPKDKYGKPNQKLVKVSLGAEKSVEFEKVKSTSVLVDRLKKEGYKILALEQDKKSQNLFKFKLNKREKYVLILGEEKRGLPGSILRKSDKILEIPMKGVMVRQAHHPRRIGRGKESLNVAVAFGIAIFHISFSKGL